MDESDFGIDQMGNPGDEMCVNPEDEMCVGVVRKTQISLLCSEMWNEKFVILK